MDVVNYTFINRVVDKWDSMSERCVSCTNVICFKKSLKVSVKLQAWAHLRHHSVPTVTVHSQ